MKDSMYKWVMLLMLSAAHFFHQADRALFGLLTIPIQEELGLSDIEIGWINTILSWTIAGMAFIAGLVGDRCSRKWIITISLMAWSLMTFMMGFVGDWRICGIFIPAFFVVMFFRSIATGVGESFYGPCYPPLIAAFHRETRSLALSIHQGALYFSLMTSGVITAWVLGFLDSWRQVFMVFGAAGFLLGVFFVFGLRDAPTQKAEKQSDAGFFAGVKYFFKTPTAICAMAGFAAIVFVNNAYLFWAPKFMAAKFAPAFEQMLDVSAASADGMKAIVGKAGALSMFYHHMMAFPAILIGGAITDRLVRRMPRFRLGFQILALIAGAPCLVFAGFAPTVASMVVMTAAYGVFRGFFEANTHATLFDVIPARFRSTAVGLFAVFPFLIGGLSGVVMGVLSQRYGVRGFEYGFVMMGASYVLGAFLMTISFFRTFMRDRISE